MFWLLSGNSCHQNCLVDLPCRVVPGLDPGVQKSEELPKFRPQHLHQALEHAAELQLALGASLLCGILLRILPHPSTIWWLIINVDWDLSFDPHISTLCKSETVYKWRLKTSKVPSLSSGRMPKRSLFWMRRRCQSWWSALFVHHVQYIQLYNSLTQPGGRWISLAPCRSLGTTRMRWEPGKWRGMVEFCMRSAGKPGQRLIITRIYNNESHKSSAMGLSVSSHLFTMSTMWKTPGVRFHMFPVIHIVILAFLKGSPWNIQDSASDSRWDSDFNCLHLWHDSRCGMLSPHGQI